MDFTLDEQVYLNHCAVDVAREDFLSRLDFHLLASVNDEEVSSLLAALKPKLSGLTDDQWETLQDVLPFDVPIEDFDTADYAKFVEREP